MVAKDEESYRYLAESIRRFPPQAKFAGMIARGGPRPGQGAQSFRRHRRHAFGLAHLMGAVRQFLAPAPCRPGCWPGRRGPSARRKPDAGARLGRALERLGPAYIKLGQMLATRPDIVGEEMAPALEHLQDRLPPFSESEARAEIARAFGKPVEALFSSFGAPLAAASIAQVHRAQTSDDAAGTGGGENPAPQGARAISPAIWKRWPSSPAPPSASPPKRGGCA